MPPNRRQTSQNVPKSSPSPTRSLPNIAKCLWTSSIVPNWCKSSQNVPHSSENRPFTHFLTSQNVSHLLLVPRNRPQSTQTGLKSSKMSPLFSCHPWNLSSLTLWDITAYLSPHKSPPSLLWIRANSSQLIFARRKSSQIASISSRNASTRRKDVQIVPPSCE